MGGTVHSPFGVRTFQVRGQDRGQGQGHANTEYKARARAECEGLGLCGEGGKARRQIASVWVVTAKAEPKLSPAGVSGDPGTAESMLCAV